jgi:hypothetical protein
MNIKYIDSKTLMINDIYLQFIKKIKVWHDLPYHFKSEYYPIKTRAGSIILKQKHNIIIIQEIYFLPEFREKGLLKRIIKSFETEYIFRKNKIKIQSILNKKLWEFFNKRTNWNTVSGEYSMILDFNAL